MKKLLSPILNQLNIEEWNQEEKKSIIQKNSKLVIAIKWIGIKIEIKNKLEENHKFLIEEWN